MTNGAEVCTNVPGFIGPMFWDRSIMPFVPKPGHFLPVFASSATTYRPMVGAMMRVAHIWPPSGA